LPFMTLTWAVMADCRRALVSAALPVGVWRRLDVEKGEGGGEDEEELVEEEESSLEPEPEPELPPKKPPSMVVVVGMRKWCYPFEGCVRCPL